MKKQIFMCISAVILALYFFNYAYAGHKKASDAYIRDRVIQLSGNGVACTGIQVKAPSGQVYILTAAHCKVLLMNGVAQAGLEDGEIRSVNLVSIDPIHDLMLLSNADNKSIEVASSIHRHEHIHTITHGMRHPSYRTDGELLEEQTLKILTGAIENDEALKECQNNPGHEVIGSLFGIYCQVTLTLHMSTALVAPGSSGGPALDSAGRLIGIVSCSDGLFSGLVPLHEIKHFLENM